MKQQVCVLVVVFLSAFLVASFARPADNSPLCQFCLTTTDWIEGFIRENATEQEIINIIDQACNFAPSSWRAECKIYVQQEVPVIIQLVEDNESPEVICLTIGVCHNSTEVIHGLCTFFSANQERRRQWCVMERSGRCSIDDIPVEILIDILTLLPVPDLGSSACLVCKKWYNVLFRSSETLSPWRHLLQRDYQVASKDEDTENHTWLQIYKDYASWSWSTEFPESDIILSDKNTKATLTSDDNYRAVLTRRTLKNGTYFFEVTVLVANNAHQRELGFGVGNAKLASISGFHVENNAAGWYSNGTCFIRGDEAEFSVEKWDVGDILGVYVNIGIGEENEIGESVQPTRDFIQFYKNRVPVGDRIRLVNPVTDPPYVCCLLGYQQSVSLKYIGPIVPEK